MAERSVGLGVLQLRIDRGDRRLVYIKRQRRRLWVGWHREKSTGNAQDRERDDINLGVAKVEECVGGGASHV